MAAQNEASSSSGPASTTSVSVPLSFKPSIILPPRSSVDNLFAGGVSVSPGPMTLVSSFFSDNDPESECRSFSQLLAGAMASPMSVAGHKPAFTSCSPNFSEAREDSFQFQRSSNSSFCDGQPNFFTIPPGLSPASLLDSPAFISRTQGSYGISHQQALAQVTAQAAQTSYMHLQAECAPSTSASVVAPIHDDHLVSVNTKPYQIAQKPNVTHMAVDRPADDGYNWRKYGQKLVKGSDFPRSYYKCTHPDCPVRKKVERSLDGQITEIIYKGQHNHQPPPPSKRSKDVGALNGNSEYSENSELGFPGQNGKVNEVKEEVGGYLPSTLEGSTDSGEVGDGETIKTEDNYEEEPALKRRSLENPVSEAIASHRSITEPRIIVQTTSEVDLLDDGYRWRKYGQKVVKGNLYPRSYYKCTSAGCNVRKHVERAATDPKAVVTTYEGKHNHDVPTNKRGSHSTSNYNSVQLKPQSTARNGHAFPSEMVNVDARPRMSTQLKIKEEEAL